MMAAAAQPRQRRSASRDPQTLSEDRLENAIDKIEQGAIAPLEAFIDNV